jgi:hypothetical protein
MAFAVNQNMKPDRRSSRESRADAITAMDALSAEATTFVTKRIRLTIFDRLIANLSLFANCLNSS